LSGDTSQKFYNLFYLNADETDFLATGVGDHIFRRNIRTKFANLNRNKLNIVF